MQAIKYTFHLIFSRVDSHFKKMLKRDDLNSIILLRFREI